MKFTDAQVAAAGIELLTVSTPPYGSPFNVIYVPVTRKPRSAKPSAGADLRKFFGTDVRNAANETIGEIVSVFVPT